MHPVTRLAQLTAVTAIGLSLAACGSSSSNGVKSSEPTAAGKSPTSTSAPATSDTATATDEAGLPSATTLIHQARAAYRKAKSASMHADIAGDDGRQKTDITGTMDGTNQELKIDQGAKGSVTVRTVGGKYYMNGNQAFWSKGNGAPANTAKLLADKWVIAPASSSKDFAGITIRAFLDQAIGNTSDAQIAKSTVAKTTYEGKEAYAVTSARTKNTVIIDPDTKFLLKFDETKAAKDKGTATITGWNEQQPFPTPAGAIEFPSNAK